MRYRIIYYIAKGTWINKGIRAITWLPNIGTIGVTHVSFWGPDKFGKFSAFLGIKMSYEQSFTEDKVLYLGQCWTSTTRKTHSDDPAGTKVRDASLVLKTPENWYYTEHEVDGPSFFRAMCNAKARVRTNKGYAFRDLTRFIMPLWLLKATRLADNGREICSEHVEQWLVDMGVLKKNTIPSPRRLWRNVVKGTDIETRRLSDNKVMYVETKKVK